MLSSKTTPMDKRDLSAKKTKNNISILKENEKLNGDKDCYNINSKENGFQNDSSNSDNDTSDKDKNQIIKEPSLIDEKNTVFNKDNSDKNLFHVTNFFNCNENYFKEKMLDANNFRLKSKNYKEKFIYNDNKKIEDIEPNKINNILREIYLFQNNLNNNNNNNNNKLDEDINFMRKKELDLNKSLNLYINNNEFGCKYIILILYLFIAKNNFFLNYYNLENVNVNEGKNINKELIKENKKVDDEEAKQPNGFKPKKKLVLRAGDWYCGYCNNLNFSFRKECNICRLSKSFWY